MILGDGLLILFVDCGHDFLIEKQLMFFENLGYFFDDW